MSIINVEIIPHVMFIGSIGGTELFIIFLIVLLLFGAKRLPEIAQSMGKAINELKKTKDNVMNYTEDSEADSTQSKSGTKNMVSDQAEKQEVPEHSA